MVLHERRPHKHVRHFGLRRHVLRVRFARPHGAEVALPFTKRLGCDAGRGRVPNSVECVVELGHGVPDLLDNLFIVIIK